MVTSLIWAVIALSQLVLGVLFLAVPQVMLPSMGVEGWAQGLRYPLAMFSARLLVTGALMLLLRRRLQGNPLAIDAMIAVQAIDLVAGIVCGLTGIINVGAAAMPMVNAALFMIGLTWIRPVGKSLFRHA